MHLCMCVCIHIHIHVYVYVYTPTCTGTCTFAYYALHVRSSFVDFVLEEGDVPISGFYVSASSEHNESSVSDLEPFFSSVVP